MKQLCLRYTKNEVDATEILNTGFLKVFKSIHKYEPLQASLYSWIRTILVNSCIDFVKQKAKNEQMLELADAENVYIDACAINNLSADALLQLIRRLTPVTQAVFNLYVIEGYNHKETAALLNISEGTSRWYLSEARKHLKQLIMQQEVNHE